MNETINNTREGEHHKRTDNPRARTENESESKRNENERNRNMKTIHNGKRYDSEKCEILAKRNHYSHSNNYSGTTYIVRASDGTLLIHTDSNGQDCYLTDEFFAPEEAIDFTGYKMDDDQAARCVELGLIVDVQ